MIRSILFCIAATMPLLVGGCAAKNLGPPDQALTLEVVTQDIAKYQGKRVRWYGKAAEVETKNAASGTGGKVNAVFIDTSTDFTKVMRGFAIEVETEKDLLTFMMDIQSKPCWVIGTIDGTRKMKAMISGGVGKKEIEVPFLTDVQIETDQSPAAKP